MIKVGITGGIGSGKTTVCKIFECLNVPVFYADQEAKDMMQSGKELKGKIESLFGSKAYDSNGNLNRSYISSKVFSNKSLLKKLNQLVHPAVHASAEKWFKRQGKAPYALYEAALIFEAKSQDRFDYIISVIAPKKLCIERVVLRDKVTASSVRARMNNQMSQWEKLKLSDFQVRNNGKKLLLPQIMNIHQELIKKSQVK